MNQITNRIVDEVIDGSSSREISVVFI